MFNDIVRLLSLASRAKLLKFFLLQPDVRASAATAAGTLGISKDAARRELLALGRAGILVSRGEGRGMTWGVNPAHPLADALTRFLSEATTPADEDIKEAFRGVPGVALVVASGVLVGELRSSVDLLIVVRNPKDPRVAKAIQRLERMIALPLRYAVYETKEYTGRMEARDRILRDVFEFSHRVAQGRA